MLLLFRLLLRTKRTVHTSRSLLLVRQHSEGQISASASLADRRIVDELLLTGLVRSTLMQSADRVSPAALRAWEKRRARAFARANARGVAVPSEAGPRPTMATNAMVAMKSLSSRIAAKLRHVRNGHRLEEHFHAAPIDQEQIDEVRGLGLDFQQRCGPSL